MRLHLPGLLVLLFPLAVTAQATPATPEAVVRRYLELGARGDLAGARRLVEPGCDDTAVGRVEAVTILGARMTLRTVQTRVESPGPAAVRVRYTATGAASARHATTRILGATVRIGNIRADRVTRSGVLRVVRTGAGWRVSCRGG